MLKELYDVSDQSLEDGFLPPEQGFQNEAGKYAYKAFDINRVNLYHLLQAGKILSLNILEWFNKADSGWGNKLEENPNYEEFIETWRAQNPKNERIFK